MKRYRIGGATICACDLDSPSEAADAAKRLASGQATLSDARLVLEWIEGSPACCGDNTPLPERSAVKRTAAKLHRLIRAEAEVVGSAGRALGGE